MTAPLPPLVRLPRVEALLGGPIDTSLGVLAIEGLVEQKVMEFDQLDFKEVMYDSSEKKKADLAVDVAAFANHTGGLIIVGVADVKGRASKAIPFEASDKDARHVRSVIAQRVAPFVPVEVVVVGTGSDAFLLIAVPASPWAPHAVIVPGQHQLRYVVRNGSQARPLSPTEVADRFRERQRAASGQVDRLARVVDEGTAELDPSRPWLYVASVPNVLVEGTLTNEVIRDWNTWLDRTVWPSPGGHKHVHRLNEVGVRRAIMADRRVADTPTGTYAELHADGCAFAADQTPPWHRSDHGLVETWRVDPWMVVDRIAGLLSVQAQHAIRTAGGNEGLVEVSLIPADPEFNQTATELELGAEVRVHRTRARSSVTPSRRTLDLAAIATSAPDLLVATRLLATDIVQAFGLAEVPHVDAEGRFVRTTFNDGQEWREVQQWANAFGAEVV